MNKCTGDVRITSLSIYKVSIQEVMPSFKLGLALRRLETQMALKKEKHDVKDGAMSLKINPFL
jgi:hypothetical protein